MVLFAVTEGEDKPVKYPTLYDTVDLALITKVDLAEAVGFDLEQRAATSTRCGPASR